MSRRPRFTGGQYSLCRALLGGSLAFWALGRLALAVTGSGSLGSRQTASALLIGVAALSFAAGWHDRVAAILILASLASLCLADELPGSPALLVAVFWLLLAHLFVPPAPYGSFAARGRPDPDGGWRPPAAIRVGTFTVLVTIVAAETFFPRGTDGAVWGIGAAFCAAGLLLLFAANPGWIRGRNRGAPETLFYDGTCGLCHRAVRFLLAEDPGDGRFRFAPLQGAHFRSALGEAQRRDLPDSLVLLARDGRVLTRWRAVRHGLIALGGYWAILGRIGVLVPPALGDAVYDLVARVRHRLFARPPDACPITPAHLRGRFILD